MLLDSNLIIYAALPENIELRRFIRQQRAIIVSAISLVEVLRFHKHTAYDLIYFETFFGKAKILPLEEAVLYRAAQLRQTRKMGIGDALIAATCLIHDLTLVTRNTDDFIWIDALRLLNPIDSV